MAQSLLINRSRVNKLEVVHKGQLVLDPDLGKQVANLVHDATLNVGLGIDAVKRLFQAH
ncbi:hypothetical protein D3C72_2277050 [compost metagenome]